MPSVTSLVVDQGCEAVEEYGEIKRLTGIQRVTFVSGDTVSGDSSILQDALDATDDDTAQGVPSYGASAVLDSNLVLVRRSPRYVTPTQVDIELEYRTKSEAGIEFVWRGDTAAFQIETEKDYFGWPIVLSHTYPDPWVYNPSKAGLTFYQGATVPAEYPSLTLVGTGMLATDFPHVHSVLWSKRVNSSPWMGAAPRKWRVETVSYEPVNIGTSPKRYQFTFTLLLNLRGHDPDAIFFDEDIGRPPPYVVPGVGAKTVVRYPERDFNELWPMRT